jgi:GNAT superfamily N-acetyltransferase
MMDIDIADMLATSDIGQMTFAEAEQIFALASREGWNPGRHDLQCAWECDPDAFIALRYRGKMIAGGSIFRHTPSFGFMGLFIVDEAYRGYGLGRRLWHRRLQLLRARLAPDAVIGMDGVFPMESFYAAGGFEPAYETVRYQGVASGAIARAGNAPMPVHTTVSNDILLAYDRDRAPYDRSALLASWLSQPEIMTAATFQDGVLVGFGMARPAETGFKIGPLVADDTRIAQGLLANLVERLDGAQVQIDVPSPNQDGVALAKSFGLEANFGCRRMYFGGRPEEDISPIFGAMSLEFG